jgi:hypothetical protein
MLTPQIVNVKKGNERSLSQLDTPITRRRWPGIGLVHIADPIWIGGGNLGAGVG